MLMIFVGKTNETTSKDQFFCMSLVSQIFRVCLFLLRGTWMRFRSGPLPVQLSCQKLVVFSLWMNHLVSVSHMLLTLQRLAQMGDLHLEALASLGYLFFSMSAWSSFGLVRMCQRCFARRALFLCKLFLMPRPPNCLGFVTVCQLKRWNFLF